MSKNEDLPTLFDPATLVRKGLCPVMTLQGQDKSSVQSHSLYFGEPLFARTNHSCLSGRVPCNERSNANVDLEQHGTGPDKMILING